LIKDKLGDLLEDSRYIVEMREQVPFVNYCRFMQLMNTETLKYILSNYQFQKQALTKLKLPLRN